MSSTTKTLGGVFAALFVVLALVLGAAYWATSGGDEPTASLSQAVSTEDPPVPTPTADEDPVDCLAQFTQRDITDPKLNRFIGDGIDAETANKSRQKFLAAVGHDASILRFYAMQFGIDNLPSEAKMLTDDSTCLSEAGRQVHHDLAVVMNASGVKFGEAPDGVYNSGINNKGVPVIDTAPGIRGNKKSLKVTLPDGSQVIMLVRCGNPVFEQPPDDFVPGPTDNPEPECEQNCEPPPTCEDFGNCEPPPTEECPPGQTGTPPNCLEVKHPGEDPGPQGNAPEGGGHNDTNGPGVRNPEPTFSPQPHTNPPPPPPPAPSPTPSPTQPPEGGGSDGGQDNPPGDPGMP